MVALERLRFVLVTACEFVADGVLRRVVSDSELVPRVTDRDFVWESVALCE